ncbi:kinase-like domain-containing protein [Obelidium mucronatum]|nr:kinase-like domain-containing protein [Obelidium mucronatum]
MSDYNSSNDKPKPEGSATKLEDFRLMCKLGEGTFSEVLKVKHKRTGQIYAMKRFRKHFNTFEEIEGLREIQALKRLNPHPHIVDLHDVVFEPRNGNLLMTESKAKMYMHQICKGLEYIHGFVCNNVPWNGLKSIVLTIIMNQNILVKDFNIKIADFGSCRGIHSKQPYTEYIATRWYRPPECLLCDGIYTFKMDIWSAGCVLYEVISKQPLFPGSNELDQIHRIHNVMGTPSPKLLKQMLGSRASSPKFQFTPKEGTGIRTLLPYVSQDCVDIINALLIYNPDERITAKDALKHGFFKDINTLKSNSVVSQDSLNAAGKVAPPAKSKNNDASDTTDSNVTLVASSTYIKAPPKEEHKVQEEDQSAVQASSMVTIAESESLPSETDITDAATGTHSIHRPKAKEVEPQMNDAEKPPQYHSRKPSEHIHLPAIPNLEHHHKQHSNKPHHSDTHGGKHHEKQPHEKAPETNHPELDLFIGHAPTQTSVDHHTTHTHTQHQPPPKPNHQPLQQQQQHQHQQQQQATDTKHLPSLFSNTTYHQQQQHQAQIQKQLLVQQQQAAGSQIQQQPKMQYLQPLGHATGIPQQQQSQQQHQEKYDPAAASNTNTIPHGQQQQQPPAAPTNAPAINNTSITSLNNNNNTDSTTSSSTSIPTTKEPKRRTVNMAGMQEKKAAEALLARARRIQQVGGAPTGVEKRNSHKVGRLHGGAGGAGNGAMAAAAADPMMFGVVGKNAPSNNTTKFPVLSFVPPQNGSSSLLGQGAGGGGGGNLPPLQGHDMETKSKFKFAQSQIPKDAVMLPSLTDKSTMKLSLAPSVLESSATTNLPALKRK